MRAGDVPFLDLEESAVLVLLVRMKDRVMLPRMGLRVDLVEAVSSAGAAVEVGIVGDGAGSGDIVGAVEAADMVERIAVVEEGRFGILKDLKDLELDCTDTVDIDAAAVAVRVPGESTRSLEARSSRSSVR